MLIVEHPEGNVAVASHSHGWMCGQLARAWGNDDFDPLDPAEEVCLAAEQHDLGMARYDLRPGFNSESGLPADVMTMDLAPHLELQIEGPELLSAQSRYAALLASLKHCAMYERPSMLGKAKSAGRQIDSFLDRSAELQARLRSTLDVTDDEVDRNWRLVRAFDSLSHNILMGRAPRVRKGVPSKGSSTVDLALDRAGDAHSLNPWPFAADRVTSRCEGRLLRDTYPDGEALKRALDEAEWVTLEYELVPA